MERYWEQAITMALFTTRKYRAFSAPLNDCKIQSLTVISYNTIYEITNKVNTFKDSAIIAFKINAAINKKGTSNRISL